MDVPSGNFLENGENLHHRRQHFKDFLEHDILVIDGCGPATLPEHSLPYITNINIDSRYEAHRFC